MLVILTAGCADHAVQPSAPVEVRGTVTTFGRVDHTGTTVTVIPGGQEASTDRHGDFEVGALRGGTLRIERAGFATTVVPPHQTIDVTLFRGRAFALPGGFVVAQAHPLPPSSLIVWDADGDGLLLDLDAGEVRLELPPGWTPYADLDGWIVSHAGDLVSEVDAIRLDGAADGSVRGWTPHGAIERGDERAIVVSRPWPDDPIHLQVGLWRPGGALLRYPAPVLEVGPRITLDGRIDTALLTDGGVWWWGAAGPERVAQLNLEEARSATFLRTDAAVLDRVCYALGARGDRRVECAGAGGVRPLAEVGGADIALLADGALAWRTGDSCRVRLVDGEEAGPYPCDSADMQAWPSGAAVVVWDADQDVHRVSPHGGWTVGNSPVVAVAETGVVGLVVEGALTVMHSDGRRRRGATLEGEPTLFAAAHGMLALDPATDTLHWLGLQGGTQTFALRPADRRVLGAAERVMTDRSSILLAGPTGVLHVDLASGRLRRVDPVGGTWAAFTRLAGTGLPDVGLLRVDDGFFAVDLYTGRRDPLGTGQLGGVVGRRAWLADGARLYVVDDPGAMPR